LFGVEVEGERGKGREGECERKGKGGGMREEIEDECHLFFVYLSYVSI
jgi:hypothetical protein